MSNTHQDERGDDGRDSSTQCEQGNGTPSEQAEKSTRGSAEQEDTAESPQSPDKSEDDKKSNDGKEEGVAAKAAVNALIGDENTGEGRKRRRRNRRRLFSCFRRVTKFIRDEAESDDDCCCGCIGSADDE